MAKDDPGSGPMEEEAEALRAVLDGRRRTREGADHRERFGGDNEEPGATEAETEPETEESDA